MNHSIYIFGKLGAGFTQYPDDYTNSILQVPITELRCASQIVLFREGNLVYYTYYRKILGEGNTDNYLGFSICFNSVICTNIKGLFEIFERGISELAINGGIIEFSNDGDIIPKIDSLYLQQVEINRLVSSISNEIDSLTNNSFQKLPPVNYGGEKESKKHCSVDDAKKQIPILLQEINSIIFEKDNNYNTAIFTGYARKIADLFSKNKELEKENKTLKQTNNILNRKKKQYRLIVLLTVLILLSIITLLVLRNDIYLLRGEVEKNEAVISGKTVQIDSLKGTISILNDNVKTLKEQIDDKNKKLTELTDFLTTLKNTTVCPISISDIEVKNEGQEYGETIYSSNTTFIYSRMTAYSLIEGEYDIYIKFFTPSGLSTGRNMGVPSDFSYKSTVSLKQNSSTTIYIEGWGNQNKGNWKSGFYRIEYWFNDIKLGTKYFYIN